MDTIRMVAISGRGSSLFSSRMGDIWRQGSPFLGQGEDIYARAKAAVAQWDVMVERLRRIANKTVRDDLAFEYGVSDPKNDAKGQYTRIRVGENIATAEAYVPVNYLVFRAGDVVNRVARLEDRLGDFRRAVEEAEVLYGILPEPQVITQTITQTINQLPPWVLPVGLGVVGLGLLGAFGVIKI